MRLALGIDPGVGGALALVREEIKDDVADYGLVGVWDLPWAEFRQANGVRRHVLVPGELDDLIARVRGAHLLGEGTPIWIEQVHASPGMGSTSAFSMGRAVGTITGVLQSGHRGLDLQWVTPGSWKHAFRLAGGDKDAARALASALFPDDGLKHWPLKKHHDRAEAALIAVYGLRKTRVTTTET